MGKKLKKNSKKSSSSGIEDYGFDEVDDYFNKTYDNNDDLLMKDFVGLTADADPDSSDDEKHMKAMGLESHGNQISLGGEYKEEEEEEENSKRVVRRDWGRKAENFYEEGLDFDDGDGSEAESDIMMQEEEAVEYQTAQLEALREADFETEDLLLGGKGDNETTISTSLASTFEKELDSILCGLDTTVDVEELGKSGFSIPSLKSMSSKERRMVIEKDHPELLPLLKEMKEKSDEITHRVTPILERVEVRQFLTSEGLSFLEMKHQLLLCYLQYLCYYILLKLNGHFVSHHPVIERLVEIKLLLGKVKPIEAKLQTQVSELLSLNQKDQKNSSSALDRQNLKPRPDLLVPFGGEDSHHLSGASALLDSDEEDEIKEATADVYRPPKLVAMEYVDKTKDSMKKKLEKQLEKDNQKAKNSEIVESLREQFQETPLEFGGLNTEKLFSQSKEAKLLLQRQTEKEAFEQENMLRLPTTKADKKAQRLLKEKQKLILGGGSTLNELTSFADSAIDSTFDDLPLGMGLGLGSKKASRLAASLAAVQQASEMLQRRKKGREQQESDLHVTARQIDRSKKHAVDVDGHFGGGSGSDEGNESMPDIMRETLEHKEMMKAAKREKYREQRLKTLPTLDETVEGKRGTSYQIDKNKGLIRKRKSIEGSARAHNRMKYERKLKRFKGMQQSLREGKVSGHYDGETTGIKTNLARSTTLA